MTNNFDYTYILYLHINHLPYNDEIIFLGSCEDRFDLYWSVFTMEYIKPENKPILLVWKTLVEKELSNDKQQELNDCLKFSEEDEYSFTIKHMTLNLQKIQKFD